MPAPAGAGGRRLGPLEAPAREASGGGPAPPRVLAAQSPSRGPAALASEQQVGSLAAPGVVLLNVYDVTPKGGLLRKFNQAAAAGGHALLGGIFHSGVEVYGREWSYGLTTTSRSGVFDVAPRQHPLHAYRGTVVMGTTAMARPEVGFVLARLRSEWRGDQYSILHHNCHSFSNKLLEELGLRIMPGWVDRAPRVLAQLDRGCCLCHCGLQRSRACPQSSGAEEPWIKAPECSVAQPGVGAAEELADAGPLGRCGGDDDGGPADEEPGGDDWTEDIQDCGAGGGSLAQPGPCAVGPPAAEGLLARCAGDLEEDLPSPTEDVLEERGPPTAASAEGSCCAAAARAEPPRPGARRPFAGGA